jgi:hypothetical protein
MMTTAPDKRNRRRRYLLVATLVILGLVGGTVLYYLLSSNRIPTCSYCKMSVPRSMLGTATGTMTSMPRPYITASVVANPGPGEQSFPVSVPVVNVGFTYSLGVLTSVPSTAELRLYYAGYGNTHPYDPVGLSVQ